MLLECYWKVIETLLDVIGRYLILQWASLISAGLNWAVSVIAFVGPVGLAGLRRPLPALASP